MEERVVELINEVKSLAKEYYVLTRKPLGITGEVAEVEATRLLGLELADAREPGYDAIMIAGGKKVKVQIKGRRLSPGAGTGRVGAINLEKPWDTVILVALDEEYEVTEIREATRTAIKKALRKPGSKARNTRGQLSMSQFRAISEVVWER